MPKHDFEDDELEGLSDDERAALESEDDEADILKDIAGDEEDDADRLQRGHVGMHGELRGADDHALAGHDRGFDGQQIATHFGPCKADHLAGLTDPHLKGHGERRLNAIDAELNARINRLANALARRDIGRGARISILSENQPAYLELELAAAWSAANRASGYLLQLAKDEFA
mgnify:CR=1 FL=1